MKDIKFADQKRELLAYLLQEEGIELQATPTISKRENPEELPLSFAQQQLWFLDQLMPGTPTYNIPAAIRIQGKLNVVVLEQSLNEIVQRHEVLRTKFFCVDDQPVQVIVPDMTLTLAKVNLQKFPDTEREAQVMEIAVEEAQQPFDLTKDSLIRAKLLCLSTEEHVLLLTMHHAVSDGWSLGVFMRELGVLYEAFSTDKPSPLPALPIQYGDFAVWQRHHLQGEVLKTQLDYWKQKLSDNLPVLDLPTDRPRPTKQTFRGAKQSFFISKPLLEELKILGQQQEATLFITLLTALKTLLYRYLEQEKIMVGSPVANRNQIEIENLIGCFVNTVVFLSFFEEKITFTELLWQVRDVVLDTFKNQNIPFEKLVESLSPERNLSHAPLFQTMFAFQNTPMPCLEFSGLKLSPLEIDNKTAKFDLTLNLEDTPQGLEGWFEYSTDLFDQSTIVQMIENFQTILETVVTNPQQQIDQIPLQRLPERQQECQELTIIQSSTDCSSEKTYIAPQTQTEKELAEIWCQVLEVESVSINDNFFKLGGYSLRAAQVVHRICKTFEIDLPLASLFEEPTILALAGNIEKLRQSKQGFKKSHKVEIVPRDRPLPLSFSQASLWFLAQLQPDNSAYNISAAVRIEGALDIATLEKSFNEIVRRHEVLRSSFRVINGQAVQVISPTLILPLSVLDLQHLPNQHLSAEVQRLANEEAEQSFDLSNAPLLRVTLLRLATQKYVLLVTMHHIISDGWSTGILIQELSHLYQAFAMGLPSSLPPLPIQYGDFANWQQQWLQGEVLESQMSYWKQQLAGVPNLLNIPTDYPRPNVQTFRGAKQRLVLSLTLTDALKNLSHQEEVTLFMTLLAAVQTLFYRYSAQEDIVVGSPVANRNQLETERLIGFFVNTLVLRTDLSGNPSFQELLGRIRLMTLAAYEHQDLPFEKLVEELQPERNLSYNPLFQAMFSLNVPTPTLDLPALTVSHLEIEDKTAKFDLTLNLEDTPQGLEGWFEYSTDLFDQSTIVQMIENFQTILETVVTNPQQQIDQIPLQRLPERQQECQELTIIQSSTDCSSEKTYIAPQTQTEKELAEIWCQVLEVESVSINDNFFKLGGYSLRAAQVVHRICKTFEIDLPLASLFEEPTILALAGNIEKLRQSKQGFKKSHKVEIVPRDRPLPLSFSQASLWFLAQLQPDNSAYNISAAVRIEGALDIATLEKSFNEIVRRHEVLRSSFRVINGQAVQVISPTLILPLSVLDLQHLPNQHLSAEVQRLANEEAEQSFDLSNAPLLRVTLLRLATQKYVLLVTMHHIISDGWSTGILIQELSHLYQAFAMGLPSSLPPLPIQYGDFANWQQQWLQGEVLESQMSYWKQQLAGVPNLLNIPTDYPRPNVQTFRGAKQRLVLSLTLTDALKNLSHQEEVTLFMTLLAAVQTLFYRYSAQEDIVVGSPVANRNQLETERLIGFFVNTLVLRTDLSGNPSFQELLGRIRLMTLAAYEHQDLPFEKLVEELQPERNLSYNPLFQAMFSLNVPTPTLDLPALTVSHLEIEDKTAKFDLTLNLEDTPQGLEGWFEYSTDLFDQSTIVQMIENFQTILETVVTNPQQQIDQIPLQRLPERKVDTRALPTTKLTVSDVPYVSPRDTIELLLAQIWSELLNKNPVGVQDNFFELGGYSLLAVQLIAQIQQKFKTLLPLEALFQAPTIEHLAKLMRTAPQTLPFSALVPIQPQGSLPPLFCIHPGGGNILC